jgi:hypothetical protein
VECGEELTSTAGAFDGRLGFKWNDTLNFIQTRNSQAQFLQRIFLQAPHPIGSRGVSDEIWFESASQDRANGLIDLKQFVNPDAPPVSGAVTQVAPGGPGDLARLCFRAGFG